MAATADLQEQAGLCSVARAGLICRCSRDKIRKVIGEAGLIPAGEDSRGNPLYRTFEVCVAVYQADGGRAGSAPPGGTPKRTDPMDLEPAARNAWFQSEEKRLNLLQRMAKLLPAEDWEREVGEVYAELAQFLQSLPDTMERDADLTPQQVERFAAMIERERERLYHDITTKRGPATADAKTGTG